MRETRGRWSKIGAASAVTAVAGAGVMIFALNPVSSEAAPNITICHRHNSNSNPYGQIAPDASGVYNGHLKKHKGPVWNPTLKDQHIKWGDIIPPFEFNGSIYSQNWPSGQAIWENGCNIPDAPQTSEPPATSEPPETSSGSEPSETETITDTAVVQPTSPGPVPEGVAAGAHSVSSTSVALGGLLMAVGVGGLLSVARPWKRGSH